MKKKQKLLNLPKLKQDNIKAILGHPLFDSLVEKILDRKRQEPKKDKKKWLFIMAKVCFYLARVVRLLVQLLPGM